MYILTVKWHMRRSFPEELPVICYPWTMRRCLWVFSFSGNDVHLCDSTARLIFFLHARTLEECSPQHRSVTAMLWADDISTTLGGSFDTGDPRCGKRTEADQRWPTQLSAVTWSTIQCVLYHKTIISCQTLAAVSNSFVIQTSKLLNTFHCYWLPAEHKPAS